MSTVCTDSYDMIYSALEKYVSEHRRLVKTNTAQNKISPDLLWGEIFQTDLLPI